MATATPSCTGDVTQVERIDSALFALHRAPARSRPKDIILINGLPDTRDADAIYKAIRRNVNATSPVQLGVAVATSYGFLLRAWHFNFDLNVDFNLFATNLLTGLRPALSSHGTPLDSVRFNRHMEEGIDRAHFAMKMRTDFRSRLVRRYSSTASAIDFGAHNP